MISLRLDGEETFLGENIKTPEDMCNRVNTVYSSAMDEEDKMIQLSYLIGFITALKGRLNRVCEKI